MEWIVLSNTWKIFILSIISFLVGTSEYIISGILDNIAKDLDIPLALAGQLVTIFALVYAIFTPILMALTANIDRRKLMVYSLGLFVLGNIIAFVLQSYAWFIVARVITAMGAGMVLVNAVTIATKIASKGKQGSAIATVITGFTAALIIGIPLGRITAELFDWKDIFLGIGLLGFIAMIIIYFAIPSTKGDKPVSLLQQFALLKNAKVIMALSITFFWLGGYSIVYTYLTPYLLTVSGINSKLLSGIFLIFGIASLFGSKFGGYSTDRWGVPITLTGGMVLHIIMLIMLSLVTNSYFGVLAILILWSFAAWSTGPTQQYHLATIEPESSSVLIGINQSIQQFAIAFGAGVGGILVEKVSLVSITWIGSFGIVIAIVATFITSHLTSKEIAKDIN
jgi:DHA1 family putative efflux transporter-like MFS transporter